MSPVSDSPKIVPASLTRPPELLQRRKRAQIGKDSILPLKATQDQTVRVSQFGQQGSCIDVPAAPTLSPTGEEKSVGLRAAITRVVTTRNRRRDFRE
jgi:hypothetical protein